MNTSDSNWELWALIAILESGDSTRVAEYFESTFPWSGHEREAVGWLSWWLMHHEAFPYTEGLLTKAVREVFPAIGYAASVNSASHWERYGLGHKWTLEEIEGGLDAWLNWEPVWQAEVHVIRSTELILAVHQEAIRLLEPKIGADLVSMFLFQAEVTRLSWIEVIELIERRLTDSINPLLATAMLRALLISWSKSIPEGVDHQERQAPVVREIHGLFPKSDLVVARATRLLGFEDPEWCLDVLEKRARAGSRCHEIWVQLKWYRTQLKGSLSMVPWLPSEFRFAQQSVALIGKIDKTAESLVDA